MRVLVETVIAQIRSAVGRPCRVTVGGVAARAGHSTLLTQHLARLPLTAAVIAAAQESRADFARRRLRWAEESYRRERIIPAPWELVKRAGLRPDLALELGAEVEGVVRRLERSAAHPGRAA
jgi:hypothetical protein